MPPSFSFHISELCSDLRESTHHLNGAEAEGGFPGGASVKEPARQCRLDVKDAGSIPGSGMATHSRILAWRIPRTEEPGRLQSMGPHRVGDN